ncbi:MAG: hypothetical protein KatS3mg038_2748 [Candidatus Kapaibacterium sp.]|nr:MAG: hypothetical protein KatS3mg038_2748 [Candidatus Kapabacteria bacterium]
MLEADVREFKVLEVYRLPPPWELLTLASPLVKSRWEPRRPPEYRARYGIYLWSLPASLLDAWQYMRPSDQHHVIAVMRVVPRRKRQLELEPVRSISSVRHVHFGAADVLWHRNYVAIARAVRIERLILHPEAPGEVVGLCHQYGVPVHVSQHDAIIVGDGAVAVRGKTRRVALYTEHATVSLPGRTVSGTPEDESLVALVRETIEQTVAEIRGAIDTPAASG